MENQRNASRKMLLNQKKDKPALLSKETWAFILLTIFSLYILAAFVDITPKVDEEFFFSRGDRRFLDEQRISSLFKREDQQILINVEGDIFSDAYREKIHYLTEIVSSFDGVLSVRSISSGPKDVQDAVESPLWSRLLIPENRKSTNLIVSVKIEAGGSVVSKCEDIVSAMQSEDFKIRISGFPYIVEQIRRSLVIDLRIFSSLAFVFFGIVIILIFHSWRILLGMIVTCAEAYAATFMIAALFDIKVGILTANLATIVFVLTLSHIVFLTFNWINIHPPETDQHHHSIAYDAVKCTLPASFWSMFTTVLGFLSLLYSQAKPLRELGGAGSIGTLAAFTMVYSLYPAFLRLQKPSHKMSDIHLRHRFRQFFNLVERRHVFVVAVIILVGLVSIPSLRRVNTSPSLISYFAPNSEIAQGLTFINKSGGSNPLVIVVRSKTGEPLDTNENYQKLWEMQEALEQNKYIGSIISLATLLAEGKRQALFGFLVSPAAILKNLESPQYGEIASSFISENREEGLYLLRMVDSNVPSNHVIGQIEKIVQQYGFRIFLVGGVYALQGELSKDIKISLIGGLFKLLALFTVIALIISRSFRVMLAMTLSISLIPLCIIGVIGLLKIPLDIISAPASNIAMSMGIDFCIHMVYAFRRSQKTDPDLSHRWVHIRKTLWEPIMASMFIICSGFSIFFLSSFPPTKRFGGSIISGTILAAMIAVFFFPLLNKD